MSWGTVVELRALETARNSLLLPVGGHRAFGIKLRVVGDTRIDVFDCRKNTNHSLEPWGPTRWADIKVSSRKISFTILTSSFVFRSHRATREMEELRILILEWEPQKELSPFQSDRITKQANRQKDQHPRKSHHKPMYLPSASRMHP